MISIPVSNIDEAIVAFAKVDILILHLTNILEQNIMSVQDDFYPGIYTMIHGTTRKTKRADKTRNVRLFFSAYKIRQPHDDAKFQMRLLGRDIDTHMNPSGFLQALCQPKGEIKFRANSWANGEDLSLALEDSAMLKIANFFEVPYPTNWKERRQRFHEDYVRSPQNSILSSAQLTKLPRISPRQLELATGEDKDDGELIIQIVSQFPKYIEFASPRLQNDKDTMLIALANQGSYGDSVFRFAQEEGLRSDPSFVIEAYKISPISLKYASLNLKKNKEVVLNTTLHFADTELQNDKEFCVEAIKRNGNNYRFVSESLKNDKEVFLEAVSKDGNFLKITPECLKHDHDIVKTAITTPNSYGLPNKCFQFASKTIQDNKDIALFAVTTNGFSLEYVSERLKKDKDVVLQAVSHKGCCLEYASSELKSDKDVALTAVKQNKDAIHYISNDLKDDYDVLEVCRSTKRNKT